VATATLMAHRNAARGLSTTLAYHRPLRSLIAWIGAGLAVHPLHHSRLLKTLSFRLPKRHGETSSARLSQERRAQADWSGGGRDYKWLGSRDIAQ